MPRAAYWYMFADTSSRAYVKEKGQAGIMLAIEVPALEKDNLCVSRHGREDRCDGAWRAWPLEHGT